MIHVIFYIFLAYALQATWLFVAAYHVVFCGTSYNNNFPYKDQLIMYKVK